MRRFDEEYKKELDEISPSEEQCERMRSAVLREASRRPRKMKKRMFIPIGACAAALCGVAVIATFSRAGLKSLSNYAGAPQNTIMAPAANDAHDEEGTDGIVGTGAAASAERADKNEGDFGMDDACRDEAVQAVNSEKDYPDADSVDSAEYLPEFGLTTGAYEVPGEATATDAADAGGIEADGANCNGGVSCSVSDSMELVFSEDNTSLEYDGIKYTLTDNILINNMYAEEELTELSDKNMRKYLVHFDGNNLEVFDWTNRFIGVFAPENDDNSQ